jgi:hypothetical protein
MKRQLAVVVSFTVGCGVLAAILSLALARSFERAPVTRLLVWPLLIVLLVAAGVLVAASVLAKKKERWAILLLFALLVLGFSVLSIFTVGVFVAPVGLFLLAFSLLQLFRSRHA